MKRYFTYKFALLIGTLVFSTSLLYLTPKTVLPVKNKFDIKVESPTLPFNYDVQFNNMDLDNVELDNTELDNTELDNVELDNTELDNVELDNTELDNVELDNVKLDNVKLDNTELDNTKLDNTELDNTELDNSDNVAKNNLTDNVPTSMKPAASATSSPTKTPSVNDEAFHVKGIMLSIGEGKDSVISKLGLANRILDTEYDFDYYIYNNDYKELLFIAISDNQVVGFYSDSLDFSFRGISSGASIRTVERSLGQAFSMAEVLSQSSDTYTLNVLMDKLGTQKVTGIYVLANTVKLEAYTDSVMKNIELMVFDLVNSVRARNGEATFSWSSSAALSSRKHSIDMATSNFFNHINVAGWNPGERMNAEGISYRTYSENIIAGYGSAILSNHGWFNSNGHRNNMLNSQFRYLGVGFTYDSGSTYKTYITQNFYR